MNQQNGTRTPTLVGASENWGTPRVATNGGLSCATQPDGKSRLEDQVAYWNTPRANEFVENPETRAERLSKIDPSLRPGAVGSLSNQATQWPTPNSGLAQRGSQDRHALDSGNGRNLNAEVKLWTTPQAHDVTERGAGQQPCRAAGNACLARDARLWPTPNTPTGGRTASAEVVAANGKSDHGKVQISLESATKHWPTPTVADNGQKVVESSQNGNTLLSQASRFSPPDQPPTCGAGSAPSSPTSRRRLNPAFVCWLMGLPWWWTNPVPTSFAPQAMALYRSALRTHLSRLQGGQD